MGGGLLVVLGAGGFAVVIIPGQIAPGDLAALRRCFFHQSAGRFIVLRYAAAVAVKHSQIIAGGGIALLRSLFVPIGGLFVVLFQKGALGIVPAGLELGPGIPLFGGGAVVPRGLLFAARFVVDAPGEAAVQQRAGGRRLVQQRGGLLDLLRLVGKILPVAPGQGRLGVAVAQGRGLLQILQLLPHAARAEGLAVKPLSLVQRRLLLFSKTKKAHGFILSPFFRRAARGRF